MGLMKRVCKGMIVAALAMFLLVTVTAYADEPQQGWDEAREYYYENGNKVTDCVKKIDGSYYGFGDDGHVLKGWQTIGGSKYYFSKNNYAAFTGMKKIGDDYYSFGNSGKMRTNVVLKIDGYYYGFGTNGKRASGWRTIDGNRYYFDPDTNRATTGGVKTINGGLYSFSKAGKVQTGKRTIGDYCYYFNKDNGKAYVSSLQKLDGKYYYFDENGHMQKGWQTIGEDKYYFNKYYAAVTDCIKKIGNYYYCFAGNGKMKTNVVKKVDGYYYGFGANGKRIEKGWKTIGDNKYYFDPDTHRALTDTVKKVGSYYYGFNSQGKMARGWLTVGENRYYFNPNNGRAYVDGMKKIDGDRYLFAKDGKIQTGWQKVSKKTRYFDPATGKLATGITKIGDKTYLLNSDGVKITSTGTYGGKYVIIKSNGEVLTGKGWTMYNGYKYYIEDDGYTVRTNTESLVKGKSLIIRVNKKRCVVTVYAYDSATKKYDIPVKSFVCSPGMRTPLGKHYLQSKNRWVRLVGSTPDTNTYGQWGMLYNQERNPDGTMSRRFFHSVYYDLQNDANALNVKAYNMLGTICSHGCIRLEAVNAKWLFDHKSSIKYLEIYESTNPGPFGLKRAVKLSSWHTWDPTDPTMYHKCKAKGCH